MDILDNVLDLSLKMISDMCCHIDVHLDFAMVDKKKPTRAFLDVGVIENYKGLSQ